MIVSILDLRVRQGIRLLKTIGFFLSFVAIVVFSGIILRGLAVFLALSAWWALPFFSLVITTIHLARKDLPFLKDIAKSRNYYLVLIMEYFLLASPLVIFQLWHGQYWIVGGLFLSVIAVAFMPNKSFRNFIKPRLVSLDFIPLELFELKIVIERYSFPFLMLWLISFLSYFHVAWFLLAFFFCLVMLLSAYITNEPLELISEQGSFLTDKLGINLGFVTLLFVLPFGLALCFNPAAKWILFFSYLYAISMLILAICYKYANYDPLRRSTLNSNYMSIIMIFSLLPGFILVAMVSCFYYYSKAQKRMSFYL